MALGREMQNYVRSMRGKHAVHRGTVPDIRLLEGIERRRSHRRDILEACRIGKGIDIDDLVATLHGEARHCRTDKSGTACHKDLHELSP